MTQYSCGETHQVYKNATGQARNITVKVANMCGEHTTVTVVDINGDIVNDALLSAPGGVVTMAVGAGHRLRVFCAGGQNPANGCQVDISGA